MTFLDPDVLDEDIDDSGNHGQVNIYHYVYISCLFSLLSWMFFCVIQSPSETNCSFGIKFYKLSIYLCSVYVTWKQAGDILICPS